MVYYLVMERTKRSMENNSHLGHCHVPKGRSLERKYVRHV